MRNNFQEILLGSVLRSIPSPRGVEMGWRPPCGEAATTIGWGRPVAPPAGLPPGPGISADFPGSREGSYFSNICVAT